MAEGFGLLNQRTHYIVSWVRIPFSPVSMKLLGMYFNWQNVCFASIKLPVQIRSSPMPVAQLAEHSYGKGKVPGSNPAVGCKNIIFMEIQLVLKSHEQVLVTKASQLVIFFAETLKRKTSQDWNLTVQPLPTQLKKYTLLRSPHVNKKSREQVQLKTCQVCIRLTKIKNPLAFLIILDGIKLLKLDGIQLKCSFKAHTSV